jgi:hypothetical protein
MGKTMAYLPIPSYIFSVVYKLKLHLPMKSVPITTKVMS